MFEFEKECEVLYLEQKVNKNNEPYTLVRVLTDNFSTLDLVYRGAKNLFSLIKARDKYHCKFKFTHFDKYNSLQLVDINEIAA